MPRVALSVVVPTRDRPHLLAECLRALRAELAPRDQVVVVDSASRAAGEVAAVAAAAGAELVRCGVKGAARARNAGWRAARHDHVVFVDDDMRVTEGWADALAHGADGQGVAFVVGHTVAPAGFEGQAATVTHGAPPESLTAANMGRYAASNNLLVLRTVLESGGGFDERLGPGTWFEAGEDLELLDRVLARGGAGRYAADALAVHEQWRDARQRRRLEWAYGKGMGARAAAALRRDPRRGLRLLPEVLRLQGLLTVARRLGPAGAAEAGGEGTPAGASGWIGPVLWRVGAAVGLAVGLVRLRPARG